jgi:hypothetical protein
MIMAQYLDNHHLAKLEEIFKLQPEMASAIRAFRLKQVLASEHMATLAPRVQQQTAMRLACEKAEDAQLRLKTARTQLATEEGKRFWARESAKSLDARRLQIHCLSSISLSLTRNALAASHAIPLKGVGFALEQVVSARAPGVSDAHWALAVFAEEIEEKIAVDWIADDDFDGTVPLKLTAAALDNLMAAVGAVRLDQREWRPLLAGERISQTDILKLKRQVALSAFEAIANAYVLLESAPVGPAAT